jgi:tetratricopeptide (TPR) repeat protein
MKVSSSLAVVEQQCLMETLSRQLVHTTKLFNCLNALAQTHRLASRNLPCARTWQTHIVIWPLAFLESCGSNVNSAVHALLSAIEHGNTENRVLQNILYSMSVVNAVMEARVAEAPSCVCRDELIRWHNQGYDLLKTSYPPGRSERNWEGATRSFEEALRIAPDCAASYHGLGLAYEGAKKEIEAINAWRKVKELEPNYNFQQWVRFELSDFHL